jgi:hypothetical protein
MNEWQLHSWWRSWLFWLQIIGTYCTLFLPDASNLCTSEKSRLDRSSFRAYSIDSVPERKSRPRGEPWASALWVRGLASVILLWIHTYGEVMLSSDLCAGGWQQDINCARFAPIFEQVMDTFPCNRQELCSFLQCVHHFVTKHIWEILWCDFFSPFPFSNGVVLAESRSRRDCLDLGNVFIWQRRQSGSY